MADQIKTDQGKNDTTSTSNRLRSCITTELRTVLLLSFAFFLQLAAFSPVETLQSSLNSEAGLGTLSLACLYSPYFVFAMFAPMVIRVLTPKWTIVLALFCDALYIGANYYPSWSTLVPAAALNGAMTGPMWTAKDLYIATMAKQSLQPSQKSTQFPYESRLSFYNGIIFAGSSFAGVMGQVVASAVLSQNATKGTFFECGISKCPYAVISNNLTDGANDQSKVSRTLVYILLGVFISMVLLSMTIVTLCMSKLPAPCNKLSPLSTVLSCARLFKETKMILIFPQVVVGGYTQAFLVGDYTKSYVTCGAGIGMVGYVMTCQGVCATLASLICGRAVKYTGRQVQAVFSLLAYASACAIMWLWVPKPGDSVVYFLVPGIFGMCNVVYQTYICSLLPVLFEEDKAAAFANFYAFRSLSKAISYALGGFVCTWLKLTVATILVILAFLSFIILEVMLKFRKTFTNKKIVLDLQRSLNEEEVKEKLGTESATITTC